MSNSSSPRGIPGKSARRTIIGVITTILLAVTVSLAAAHDMFVHPATFFASPNSELLVRVLNGTFSRSDNSIARPRVANIAVVTPAGRQTLDTTAWDASGDTSMFSIRTGEAGTYVVGASTRTTDFTLSAADFNSYLREDGVPDALEERRRLGELEKEARERYAKHVKAIIQVGDARSDHYATVLGYPAEIVPLSNPYGSRTQSLRFRILVDGQPVANQYVLYGGRTPGGARVAPRSVRSNSEGIATVPIRARGTWYVKFIHMARHSGDSPVDYESKWATLTFQRR